MIHWNLEISSYDTLEFGDIIIRYTDMWVYHRMMEAPGTCGLWIPYEVSQNCSMTPLRKEQKLISAISLIRVMKS